MTDRAKHAVNGSGAPPGDGVADGTSPTLTVNKVVFGVAATMIVLFVAYGSLRPKSFSSQTSTALGWLTTNFGWLFVLTSATFVLFAGYLAVTRYGNIKLGPDDSEPQFSTFSWVSMMFATGMGIGLIFWGVAEPLTHLNTPPMGLEEPGTPEGAKLAMEYTFFHWGFHPWSMYAVIGLAIGYFAYRKGYGNLISGCFRPLLGDRVSEGPGRAIDVIAIFATLFGSATSLGLGALQITGGLDNLFDGAGKSVTLAIAVICVLTACFVISAVTGIEKGVQFLSNANAIAAALLAFFLFVVGPTVFILSTFTESIGGYLTYLPTMAFRTGGFGGARLDQRLDGLLLGLVDLLDALRRDVHRPHLEGPDDPPVRHLRCPRAEPGVVRVVLDHGRRGVRPAAQPGRRPR